MPARLPPLFRPPGEGRAPSGRRGGSARSPPRCDLDEAAAAAAAARRMAV